MIDLLLDKIIKNEQINGKPALHVAIEQGEMEGLISELSHNRILAIKVLLSIANEHMRLSKQQINGTTTLYIGNMQKAFNNLAPKIDPVLFKEPLTHKNNHQYKANANILQRREERNLTEIGTSTGNN